MTTRPPDPPDARRAQRVVVRLANLQRSLLGMAFSIAGPRAAYGFMNLFGRLLYRLLDPIRMLSEAQCAAALRDHVSPARARRIAADAFIHRLWNLADLLLARRYLRNPPPARIGGRIEPDQRRRLQDGQAQRHPIILLTAYYGPYDLLPIFLGHNGLHAHVLYRPHANASYDALRQAARALGGCAFVSTEEAVAELPGLLERGETVAIVGDHHGGRTDLPVTFLGLPTRAIKSVALLACRYDATVVVAGLQRVRRSFRFRFVVGDVFGPESWADADDPLRLVTERYLRGLEQIVLSDPEQYLWTQPRWGAEQTRELVQAHVDQLPESSA